MSDSTAAEQLSPHRRKLIEQSFLSRRWCWDVGASDQRGCLEELLRRLPHIAHDSWPERFDLGGVYVAGRRAKPDTEISSACRLEYYEPLAPLSDLASLYPRFSSSFVVFMDDDVGVAFKPVGLPTTAPRDQERFNLQRYLSEYLGKPVHLPSRLDVGVGGLVLFSLSARMNRYLQRAYDRRAIERYYVAEVDGRPNWRETEVHLSLARDPRHAVLRRVVVEGGEQAHTRLSVISSYLSTSGALRSLIQAQPFTGRTHQIRVHCAASGIPIVADPYYGIITGSEQRGMYPHLASFAVRFHHPYQGRILSFELPQEHRVEWIRRSEPIAISWDRGDNEGYKG